MAPARELVERIWAIARKVKRPRHAFRCLSLTDFSEFKLVWQMKCWDAGNSVMA